MKRTLVIAASALILVGCSKAPQVVSEDDVRRCIADIYDRSQSCNQYVSLQNVSITDRRTSDQTATAVAHVTLKVTQTFGTQSEIASMCTGSWWGQWNFNQGQTIEIDKAFQFTKFDSGWRCDGNTMKPILGGTSR